MALTWLIWKARCACIFKDEKCVPELTLRRLSLNHSSLGSFLQIYPNKTIPNSLDTLQSEVDLTPSCCWCDGSFDQLERGGAAFILESQQQLVRCELRFFEKGMSPLHMEIMAVLMAIQAAAQLLIPNCTFYTDSELLVRALNSNSASHTLHVVDWRSYTELVHISRLLKMNSGYRCEFIKREENLRPHKLANLARSGHVSYIGSTFPLFSNIG